MVPRLTPRVGCTARRALRRVGEEARRSAGPVHTSGVPTTVWTVGHSTRTAEEFLAVLESHEIELVADVRRFPGSRAFPHFGAAELERDLATAGIAYRELSALGGRRTASATSANTGWRHPAFRGYADYIATEDFAGGLLELLMLAHGLRTVVVCAELLWWRCHRRIIADVLVWLGIRVVHIRDSEMTEEHTLAPPARIIGGTLTYTPAR